MGGKKKVGKARRDKFYHLAKETGYRARSAFKLIQLNRKFGFLERSRVCIDLCAAPGGWCQVAANHMPVSSIIVGVDLVPIRPIPKVTTLVDDITSDKCRADLKKELKNWKADVVLNDGAPNVGQNWHHDAFSQAGLTLHALKLASEFLRKGGWFVTKVFRSQDYHALLWVFKQLFNKVHATKPQASRNESAEIFIVCKGYLAPDKLDPKFLDPKAVFKDVSDEPQNKMNILQGSKKKVRPEGYEEGDYTQHKVLNVSEFISDPQFMERLGGASELKVDKEEYLKHPATTSEILECCKDIKILGKGDIRALLLWRKKLLKTEQELNKAAADTNAQEVTDTQTGKAEGKGEDSDDDIDEQVSKVRAEVEAEAKRKKKKAQKIKSKLRQKMNLGMIRPGDMIEQQDDDNLFDLKRMKTKSQLEKVETFDSGDEEDFEWESSASDSDDDRPDVEYYDRTEDNEDQWIDRDPNEEPGEMGASDLEDLDMMEDDDTGEERNPLLDDLGANQENMNKQTRLFFQREAFDGLDLEEDEDYDVDQMISTYKEKGGTVRGSDLNGEDNGEEHSDMENGGVDEAEEGSDESSDDEQSETESSDYGDLYDKKAYSNGKVADDNAEMEVVKAEDPKIKLDAVGLAIGSKLISSKKKRRELIDDSFNRFAFHDKDLPDWFMQDEQRHMARRLPVTKAEVQEYKEKLKAINARPIKKVAEAKGRKKRKMMKKLEKARKKAEALEGEAGDGGISEKEKWQQIKSIYKKATRQKKEDKTYIVAKKGVGKRVHRPAGVKGRFKVVDPRMKKDNRANKSSAGKKGSSRGKQSRGKPARAGGSGGRGRGKR